MALLVFCQSIFHVEPGLGFWSLYESRDLAPTYTSSAMDVPSMVPPFSRRHIRFPCPYALFRHAQGPTHWPHRYGYVTSFVRV